VPAALVADDAADVFGDGVELGDEVVDGEGAEIGVRGEGGVEVVDVGLVVAGVVDFHCFGVEVRLEGVVGVA
jgi:hypothetical protein